MIRAKHVYQEIITPDEFNKLEDMKEVYANLYKALYMNIRISLDVRHALFNLPAIKKLEKQTKFEVVKEKSQQFQNTVIKEKDNIEVKHEKE